MDVLVKRLLSSALFAMVVVSCSVSQPSNTTVLEPLMTTTTVDPQEVSYNMAFLQELVSSYGDFNAYYSNSEALFQGNQYCTAARGGMTVFTITQVIAEGAETFEEIQLENAIVHSALTHLCPDQEYRINP